MIVNDRFVYLHMHRTAGTFLRRFFSQFFAESREVGYHYPLRELPASAAGLPVVIVARDPFDWYRSVYRMNLLRMSSPGGAVNPVVDELSQRGTLDFSSTLEGLLRLGENTPAALLRRRRIAAALPVSLAGNRGVGLTRDDINGFVNGELGYYAWLFLRMTSGLGLTHRVNVLRFEDFKTTLPDLLTSFGVQVTEEMTQYLAHSAPLNTSTQSTRDTTIDESLRSLVLRKDAWMFLVRNQPQPRA